ncbi:Os06g0620100 [Oryza sativa Japonica Group]|uniref:Os06g0620100 protein n=2 Tax=Oryza TaxID=4527 RepID=A0A0P0WYS5_ORYSJ|nr:Os06g0620100 [Oryza sativa Japonica Group]
MWRVTGAAAARPHGGGEVGSDCAAGDRGSDGRVARLRQKTAATVRHTSEDGDGQATRRKRKTVTAVQWTTGTVAASPLS